MKRCKFTQSRLVEYFVTNMCNTNLLGVNSKDLSESFCLIVTKFFFTTMSLSSLIWYDFMFLSLWSVANWRRAMLGDAVDCFYGRNGMRARWLTETAHMVCGRVTHCNGICGMRPRWLTATARMVCGRVTHCNGICGMRGMWACVTHRNGMLGMSRMLELTGFF